MNNNCQYSNQNKIDKYRKEANIPNNKCSILAKDKVLDCLDQKDKTILYSKIQCEINDNECYQQKLEQYNCNDALCLLKKEYLQSKDDNVLDIIKTKHKPLQPKKWKHCNSRNKHQCHYTWLTNLDIQNVMYHYEKKIHNFQFLGIFMIDFDVVKRNLSGVNIDLNQLNFDEFNQKGINHLGIIFNTDTSSGSGIHWVSMMIFWDTKTKKGEINFFDSAGTQHQIPNTILILMKNLQSSHKTKGYDLICHINRMNHQNRDSECGVYSVYSLIYTMFNKFSDLNSSRIDDATIHMFRDILWI